MVYKCTFVLLFILVFVSRINKLYLFIDHIWCFSYYNSHFDRRSEMGHTRWWLGLSLQMEKRVCVCVRSSGGPRSSGGRKKGSTLKGAPPLFVTIMSICVSPLLRYLLVTQFVHASETDICKPKINIQGRTTIYFSLNCLVTCYTFTLAVLQFLQRWATGKHKNTQWSRPHSV